MAVRSLTLAKGREAGAGAFLVYTTPAGKTAIIKDIRAYNDTLASMAVAWVVSSGAVFHAVRSNDIPTKAMDIETPAFIVLEPGDLLYVGKPAGDLHYWISGAELEGVA